jgi:phosphoenolpyruvate carboxylase
VTSAVLLASAPASAGQAGQLEQRIAGLGERIEAAARRAYRNLVEAEGFAAWFARVSPLEEISGLRIGSRPARRAAAAGLDDLRAIPWVFAWAQTRVNLPGWFGLGSGLAAVAEEEGGLEELRRAYREWPLFAVLLDNAEMSLAKTDRRIAARYLALGGRPDLTAAVLAEHDLTSRLVLAVTGHDRLLADLRVLSRAVALRDPYVDALSYLQLRALKALRAPADPPGNHRAAPVPSAPGASQAGADGPPPGAVGDAPDPGDAPPGSCTAVGALQAAAAGPAPGAEHSADRDRLERLLLLTVNGVAAGLQNTG